MVRAARTLKIAIDQMSLTSSGMADTSKRVLAELKNIMKLQQQGQFDHIDVYPSEANLNFWKIVIEAPSTPGIKPEDDKDCMYSGAVFAAYIIFPSDFPQRAPEMRFVTPIRHVNGAFDSLDFEMFDGPRAPARIAPPPPDVRNLTYGNMPPPTDVCKLACGYMVSLWSVLIWSLFGPS